MAKQKPDETEEPKGSSDQELTQKYFETNKAHHYNFEEFRGDYKVSTGSKILDTVIGGGFSSGLIRFTGATESGKTAEALEIQKLFLETVSESKGIFIKAEGRFSPEVQERSGIKFVYSPADWVAGTSLVFECNIYEVVFDWLRQLILNPKNKTRYHIIIDSMDGLIPKDALEKTTGDAAKVAAGAVMTSDFLKRTNLALGKRGHQCIIMSQIRAEIRASQYAAKDKNKLGGASGGNAASHMPDWVLEFMRPKQDDMILQNPSGTISSSNKPIGRVANIKIWKSTNDTTMIPVSYPIKFGRIGKSAIWKEREIVDLLLQWGFFEKKGAWFNSDEKLSEYLGGAIIKTQGINNLYDALEKDEELCKKLEEFCDINILA
jgi:RecA/RadA recombinase